jgi:hypothetical protein
LDSDVKAGLELDLGAGTRGNDPLEQGIARSGRIHALADHATP